MSHHSPLVSAPGTPLLDRSVGELVAERPGRSRIFQAFQIDFCCQGGRTVREACTAKGVAPESVLEQLEAELRDKSAPLENPADLPPPALADYIVRVHHGFLRTELPRLHAMAQRVADVHGGHTPALRDVFAVFQSLESELLHHIEKEERILFPAIIALAADQPVPVPVDGPIRCMLQEHDDAGAALVRLRQLTHDFQPPLDACNTYRALFAGLADLESDLHRHIHLENSVLFPAALTLTMAAIA